MDLGFLIIDLLTILMLLFVVVLLLYACKSFSMPASGTVDVYRPQKDNIDGIGTSRTFDHSYAPGINADKGGFPISLRTERGRTDTWELAEEIHRERTESEEGK